MGGVSRYFSKVSGSGVDSTPLIEIPWTWERESRGQKPKSLHKVSKKSPGPGGPKSLKKSRNRSEKSQKRQALFRATPNLN